MDGETEAQRGKFLVRCQPFNHPTKAARAHGAPGQGVNHPGYCQVLAQNSQVSAHQHRPGGSSSSRAGRRSTASRVCRGPGEKIRGHTHILVSAPGKGGARGGVKGAGTSHSPRSLHFTSQGQGLLKAKTPGVNEEASSGGQDPLLAGVEVPPPQRACAHSVQKGGDDGRLPGRSAHCTQAGVGRAKPWGCTEPPRGQGLGPQCLGWPGTHAACSGEYAVQLGRRVGHRWG